MEKRRWSEWPREILKKLESVSGLVGIAGVALTVSGATFLDGGAATALSIGGGSIVVGVLGYAIWEAIPPVLKNASDLVGHTLDLTELANISPPIRKLAIVGPTRTGKTTLKRRLLFQLPPDERTQAARATIVSIPTNPVTYLAVLDGGGESFSQQFKIAAPADHLCLVIDHNISDHDTEVSAERKEETVEFMKQIRGHLLEMKSPQKIWIEVLANKKDLWEKLSGKDRKPFIDFVSAETRKWEDGNFCRDVRMVPHSNKNPDDVTRFMDVLKSTLSS